MPDGETNPNELDATPAAEAHAEATGVDLSTVEGTGVDGRITKADVDDAASDSTPSGPLAKASESGLPTVHFLIANRRAHEMAGEHEACYAIDKQLAELGFE